MSIFPYRQLLLIYTNEILIYKVKIILLTLSHFASPLIMMIVLSNLPTSKSSGMTSAEIINYYSYTSLLFLFLSSRIDDFVGKSILDGTIATFLLKPMHFWLVALIKDSSTRFIKLFIGIPIIASFFFIYPNIIKIEFEKAPLVILAILISFTLSFLISFSIGLFAFYVEEIWGLQNLKDVIVLLLGGVALPYNFFPELFQTFLSYTPFPYIVNWASRIGYTGNIPFEIFIALLWALILYVICRYLWFAGIKKYSGIGTF